MTTRRDWYVARASRNGDLARSYMDDVAHFRLKWNPASGPLEDYLSEQAYEYARQAAHFGRLVIAADEWMEQVGITSTSANGGQ
jgi:hypothetical protein